MKEVLYYEVELKDGTIKQMPVKYLVQGNKVEVKGKGVLTFGEWSPGEDNLCVERALKTTHRYTGNIADKMFIKEYTTWQLAFALAKGGGLFDIKHVDDIRAELMKVNDARINVFEKDRIKVAFDEYVYTKRGEVKKKVVTLSSENN